MHARSTSSSDLGSFAVLGDDPGEDRGLRIGIAAAVVLHVAAFAVTWPTLAGDARTVTEPTPRLFVVTHVRFEPPPPVPVDVSPRRPSVEIPVPEHLAPPEPVDRDLAAAMPWSPAVVSREGLEIPPPPAEIPETVRGGVDVAAPEVLHRVIPAYPEAARRVRKEGAVVLEFLIGPDGTVRDLTVLRGLPLGMTEAAVTAARQWQFAPSTLDGRPVSVRYVLTITFRLE